LLSSRWAALLKAKMEHNKDTIQECGEMGRLVTERGTHFVETLPFDWPESVEARDGFYTTSAREKSVYFGDKNLYKLSSGYAH